MSCGGPLLPDSAFQCPHDEKDDHDSDNKDENDDAKGFPGFALQKQEQDTVTDSLLVCLLNMYLCTFDIGFYAVFKIKCTYTEKC
ncbi:hypothetical protein STEG23_021961 [Scotinomys teguina]